MLETIECFSRISENQRTYIISVPGLIDFLISLVRIVIPLSANPTKWSNTLNDLSTTAGNSITLAKYKKACAFIYLYIHIQMFHLLKINLVRSWLTWSSVFQFCIFWGTPVSNCFYKQIGRLKKGKLFF